MSCNCFNTKPVFLRTDGFNARLEKSKCRCTSRFNVSERRSSFKIKCNDVKCVDKYKIDGCFDMSTELKCDYLFHYHPIKNNIVVKNSYVFVELKGSEFDHGVKQISTTIKRFIDNDYFVGKNKVEVTGVLVCTKYPKNNSRSRTNKKAVKESFPNLNFKMLYGKSDGNAVFNPETREIE